MDERRDLVSFGTTLVAQAVVGGLTASALAWQFARDVYQLVGALVRLTAPGGPIERLAGLADDLRTLTDELRPVGRLARQVESKFNDAELRERAEQLLDLAPRLATLTDSASQLAQLGDSVKQLSKLSESVEQLSRLGDSLQQLGRASESLPRLTEHTAALPELAALAREVEAQVTQISERIRGVSPDLGALAGTLGELRESARVLGGAAGPLRGTAERVGRFIELLPGSPQPPVSEPPARKPRKATAPRKAAGPRKSAAPRKRTGPGKGSAPAGDD